MACTSQQILEQAATDSQLLDINIELCRTFDLPNGLEVSHGLLAILAAFLPEFGPSQKRFWRHVKSLRDKPMREFGYSVNS